MKKSFKPNGFRGLRAAASSGPEFTFLNCERLLCCRPQVVPPRSRKWQPGVRAKALARIYVAEFGAWGGGAALLYFLSLDPKSILGILVAEEQKAFTCNLQAENFFHQ